MLSCYRFLCLPLRLRHWTVPCRIVLATTDDRLTCPYHFSLRLFTSVCVFSLKSLLHKSAVNKHVLPQTDAILLRVLRKFLFVCERVDGYASRTRCSHSSVVVGRGKSELTKYSLRWFFEKMYRFMVCLHEPLVALGYGVLFAAAGTRFVPAFPGPVIPATSELLFLWSPCQVCGVMGSVVGMAGPVPA